MVMPSYGTFSGCGFQAGIPSPLSTSPPFSLGQFPVYHPGLLVFTLLDAQSHIGPLSLLLPFPGYFLLTPTGWCWQDPEYSPSLEILILLSCFSGIHCQLLSWVPSLTTGSALS